MLGCSVEYNSSALVSRINYAHSNGSHGPHTAYIEVAGAGASLKSRIWHDVSYTQAAAAGYFDSVNGLSCLKRACGAKICKVQCAEDEVRRWG
ncbi:MAG: hypothetical protein LBU32_19905 [Clostridiales bacterium]|nr:hypothetical protein [Clostridiales bacterium]